MGNQLALNDADGQVYPRDRLLGLHTALIGFAAAFLGRQDCVWIDQAGLTATCVDTDVEKLLEMAQIYPDGWTFACRDLYEYAAERHAAGATYDIVSLDPYTNECQRCADHIGLWCDLAEQLVVIGTIRGTMLVVPDGWMVVSEERRPGPLGAYWTTLERGATDD